MIKEQLNIIKVGGAVVGAHGPGVRRHLYRVGHAEGEPLAEPAVGEHVVHAGHAVLGEEPERVLLAGEGRRSAHPRRPRRVEREENVHDVRQRLADEHSPAVDERVAGEGRATGRLLKGRLRPAAGRLLGRGVRLLRPASPAPAWRRALDDAQALPVPSEDQHPPGALVGDCGDEAGRRLDDRRVAENRAVGPAAEGGVAGYGLGAPAQRQRDPAAVK